MGIFLELAICKKKNLSIYTMSITGHHLLGLPNEITGVIYNQASKKTRRRMLEVSKTVRGSLERSKDAIRIQKLLKKMNELNVEMNVYQISPPDYSATVFMQGDSARKFAKNFPKVYRSVSYPHDEDPLTYFQIYNLPIHVEKNAHRTIGWLINHIKNTIKKIFDLRDLTVRRWVTKLPPSQTAWPNTYNVRLQFTNPRPKTKTMRRTRSQMTDF